ncbi:hypothetical protein Aph01nite_18680 [Acrocarpospora phusangensis]|uniref:Uncharacterized protein n=1 Tax=Acrocarpospora phusangensis TaxID=1070424 RepID=A0A919Q7S9_9ACTN|nr:neutral zinc metallopeptidase [Acrocarpospora phusangensis]GIH23558.1 hypothetical protein Aph01nite_18680 [Acrocarpospora phusangensis]
MTTTTTRRRTSSGLLRAGGALATACAARKPPVGWPRHLSGGQALSGIGKAADRLTGSGESEQESEHLRRYNLQARCLAGAFLGSVWKSLHRPTRDWRKFLDAIRGTGDDMRSTGERWHGTGRGIVYWVKRGFTKPSPARCNTWTAAGTLVA